MVRVIGPTSEQIGVMAISDALRLAREQQLDLVEVAPTARPPVCRIMDFGKYKYETAKKEAQARRKQHQTIVKEVKLRPKIETHDFDFKMKHARKFLTERDKVKITVTFRGREMTHPELGYELMDDVIRTLDDVGNIEQKPSMDGRMITMLMSPKPGLKAKTKDAEDEPTRATEERGT